MEEDKLFLFIYGTCLFINCLVLIGCLISKSYSVELNVCKGSEVLFLLIISLIPLLNIIVFVIAVGNTIEFFWIRYKPNHM